MIGETSVRAGEIIGSARVVAGMIFGSLAMEVAGGAVALIGIAFGFVMIELGK